MCNQWMKPGFVSVSQGLLWLRNPEGSTVDFAENIPGTNAVMRANRLPAWRCQACELLVLRYGRTVHKQLPAQQFAELPDPQLDDEDLDEAIARRARRTDA